MSWKERAKLVPEQGKEAVTTSWKDRASRVGEPSNPTLEASQPSPNSVFSNSAVPSQEPLEQQDLSNPPTPLSAAVHGFGSGLSYNFLDEAAGLIDSKAKDRIKASKQEFPTLFNIASVLGAVLSPNPVSKLKAVKEAGTAAKMAINAANFGGQVGLQAIGGSEKEGLKRLEDAKEALTDPITIGLGVLSAGAPLAIAKISKNADSIVTHGGKSFKLGKEVKDAIGSEAGQLYASRAVNQFGKDVIDEGYNSFKALAPKMDEVAAMNADNIVDLKGPLTSAYSKVIKKGSEQLEELGPDSLAMNNKLNRWLESAEAKFLSNSPEKISSKARFADVYEKKAEL